MSDMRKDLNAAREALERYQHVQDALFVLGTSHERGSFEESVRVVDRYIHSLQAPLLVSLYRRLFREPHASELISPEEGFENWYRAFLGRLVEVAKASATDLHTADLRLIASLGSGASRAIAGETLLGPEEWRAGPRQEATAPGA